MQNKLYVQVLKEDCENTEMEAVYNESLFQRWVVIRYVNSVTCSLLKYFLIHFLYRNESNAEYVSLLLKYIFYLNCFTHALLH